MKRDHDEIKFWVFYTLAIALTISIWYTFRIDKTTIQSVEYCGEVLNRTNSSAAPRTEAEYKQWNDCVFQGIKEWPSEQHN